MRVKEKSLLAAAMVILLLSGFYLLWGLSLYDTRIKNKIEDEERLIDYTVSTIQKYSFEVYRERIRRVAEERPDILAAFAERDREALLRASRSVYDSLREEDSDFHAWDFSLPDGTVFLRVQKPDLHGDNLNVSRSIVKHVHDTRRQQAGYDIGKHGAIYWVAHPIFHEGTYAGAMEFGISLGALLGDLQEKFRTEVTALVKADKWSKATFVEKGYRYFGDYVLMAQAGSVFEALPEGFPFSLSTDQRITPNGRECVLHSCAALESSMGEPIGSVLILQDISEVLSGKNRFILASAAMTLLITFFSLAFLYVSFGSLVGKLENFAVETAEAKEEAELARRGLKAKVEERTTELNQAYADLQEQHVFQQTVLESLTHPFYVIDAKTYRILMANKAAFPGNIAAEGFLSCYSMTHQRTEPCSGDDHPCSLVEVRKTKKSQVLEHIHTDKEGNPRIFQIFAYPVLDGRGDVGQVIEYCIDITDQKNAEEERSKLESQLQQAQKMEAMGTLAGGIAHDFNNILSAIFGFSELIRDELPPDSALQGRIREVLKAGGRARDLVRQILTFSRQAEQERKPLQVHLLVKEDLKLLRASIPTTIEIRQDVRDCGLVLADPTQIHQVLMNLCTNAYHAMREERGVLAVALVPVEIDGDDRKVASLSILPGKYVMLEVSDTGHGMDRVTVDRIFDPYFTTKRKGEGTGMGLAVVHGIVKSHNGHISVYSEPEIGTTFKVYLPQFEGDLTSGMKAGGEAVSSVEALPGGTERILLVDDEEQIVEALSLMLESLGYTVNGHTDSLEALATFTKEQGRFDLVVTDMTMPKMTGRELAQKILALRPDMPIILCTGFSEMIDAGRSEIAGVKEFIMKPVIKADLARLVRKALDSTG
jgi:signal transduction histidine kinase/ActR/RegA family two-component response regulator